MSASDGPPAGLATAGVGLAAGLAVLFLAGAGWLTTALGVVGLGLLGAGYALADRRIVTAGGGCLYGEVLVAGAVGAGALTTLAAGVGAFLAWTFVRTAAGLRADVGRAPTRSLELTHLSGTSALALAGAVATAVPYLLGRAAVPPLGLVGFALAAVFLTASLRSYER